MIRSAGYQPNKKDGEKGENAGSRSDSPEGLSSATIRAMNRALEIMDRSRTLAQVFTEGVPPVTYRVQTLLPVGGSLMIAAPPKQGKTFLGLELARSVATGTPFLGMFDVQQGVVIYIDEENGLTTMNDRLQRLWRGQSHTNEEAGALRLIVKEGLKLDTTEGREILRALVEEYQPAVVVLDSMVRLLDGDENKASDVRRMFDAVSGLLGEFNLSVVWLHHTRKDSRNGGNVSDSVRGSGDFVAMLDVLMTVRKARGHFYARIAEHRNLDTAEFEDFRIDFLQETDDHLRIVHGGTAGRTRTQGEKALDALLEWGRAEGLQHDSWPRKRALDALKARRFTKYAFDQAMLKAEEDRMIVAVGIGLWQFMPGVIVVEESVK